MKEVSRMSLLMIKKRASVSVGAPALITPAIGKKLRTLYKAAK